MLGHVFCFEMFVYV